MQKRSFLKQLGIGMGGLLLSPISTTASKVSAQHTNMTPIIPSNIAFIIFDGITLLDFIGIYDPLTRLKTMKYIPKLSWDICARTPIIKDSHGLQLVADKIQPNLKDYDAIIVPGGFGTRPLQRDQDFIQWIQSAQDIPYKISVCTGSLLLGAAGFLEGKRATTNFNEYASLQAYCGEVVQETIVEDGNIITAGAVSSSLDLGLYLCEKWAGQAARDAIAEKMDYKH